MQKQIERIEYFACGYCVNRLDYMFRGVPKQKLCFPAGVFLIRHRTHGYILYDTGYGRILKQKKLKYRLYDLGNPFYIRQEEEISQQLRRQGIMPEEISYIILSHLHPDHIGGARAFPHAQFIVTQELYREMGRYRMRDLVFPELLPENFEQRLMPIQPNTIDLRFLYQKSYDLFGDGSLLLASLGGHATGQACVFMPEHRLFVAADVCWGIPLIKYTPRIRRLATMIQKDPQAYFKNIRLLQQMRRDGVKVVVSHDAPARIHRVLASLKSAEGEV